MWKLPSADRLEQWKRFRREINLLPFEQALEQTAKFWSRAPFTPFYLDHDKPDSWPDPWTLIAENCYCDLARALGILYTISLLDRADLTDAALVLSQDGHNLVMVDKSKYILNWNPDTVVNTSQTIEIHRQLSQSQIKQQYN